MLNTCRCKKADLFTLAGCFFRCNLMQVLKDTAESFFAGSSAEFYIEPMLPCIGDIDIMTCFNSCLAIPAGHTPPTKLPAHYERIVIVHEIADSHQPGYVYLKPSYILTKTDNCRYEANILATTVGSRQSELYAQRVVGLDNDIRSSPEITKYTLHQTNLNRPYIDHIASQIYSCDMRAGPHGPAFQTNNTYMPEKLAHFAHCGVPKQLLAHMCKYLPFSNFDFVHCMRCLVWPPQAADWPTKSRDHDWPNRTTIDMIVSNGCDVVAAVHPRCRQDEWMMRHQWRLSFSRAEVTLLNSWTAVQQIIYHMLRYVLKRLLITSENDQELPKLCNYHIKTLMLWECEQKPQSWWSAESSLIKLCSSLLRKLRDWVEENHCRQFRQ